MAARHARGLFSVLALCAVASLLLVKGVSAADTKMYKGGSGQDMSAPSPSSTSPTSSAPPTPGGSSNAGSDVDPNSFLGPHNAARAAHGAPPLSWSASLAASAQKWANNCQLAHSSDSGVGENIYVSSGDLSDPGGAATNSWVSEEKNYNFASGGFGMNTGHFTQVVWKSSTQLGCGVARGCTGQWKTVVVCQYTPPGNFQGQFQANVLPAGGG